jgi:hypothetical protein
MTDIIRGLKTALQARGMQDAYVNNTSYLSKCLTEMGHPYNRTFCGIGLKSVQWNDKLDRVVLYLTQAENTAMDDLSLELDSSIASVDDIADITIEIGGQRMDVLRGRTHIEIAAGIFGRRITYHTTKAMIPLAMAPYLGASVTPYVSNHEVRVIVSFRKPCLGFSSADGATLALYGNIYYFGDNFFEDWDAKKPKEETEKQRQTAIIKGELSYLTYQNQRIDENMVTGTNHIKIFFNHPVSLLYFWGIEMCKVNNVKLILNKDTFFDGPIHILEHYQMQHQLIGTPPPDDANRPYLPVFFRISDDIHIQRASESTVNFSRIDDAMLIIETTQLFPVPVEVHVVALNIQPIVFNNGMAGLRFSK